MDTFRKMLRLLLLLAASLAAPLSAAQTPLSPTTSLPYQSVGRVDYVDVGKGNIVIGDVGLMLAPNVIVRNARGEVVSAGSLSKGMKVGTTMRNDGRRTVVTEIWVLPGR